MRTLKWRYILVIFVFIWTVLLFEFVKHKRKQDTDDSDANLTTRLNNVLCEIEELRKSNVELDAQLKNLKYLLVACILLIIICYYMGVHSTQILCNFNSIDNVLDFE